MVYKRAFYKYNQSVGRYVRFAPYALDCATLHPPNQVKMGGQTVYLSHKIGEIEGHLTDSPPNAKHWRATPDDDEHYV